MCTMQILHKFYQVKRAKTVEAILASPLFEPKPAAAQSAGKSSVKRGTARMSLEELKEYRAKVAATIKTLKDSYAKKVDF